MDTEITYHKATTDDIPAISAFVDYWLAGRGVVDKTPGPGHDYFVPKGRHEKFVTKYTTIIACAEGLIIGWAVMTHLGVLIHLLVAGIYRKRGIGGELLKRLNPDTVRCKTDQAAGDPSRFYTKNDYVPAGYRRQGRRQNIQIFIPAKLS